METVAFYSYKGGVGRTLLVANTAQFLAMSGRNVVALDLDLEAPGLHQKLGSREVMSRAAAGTLRGAVDELLDILENAPSERNPAIGFEEVNLPSGTSGSLRLISAGAAPSHNYWAALERLNRVLRTRSRDGGLPEAILELQARIEEELKPDFLLIDSRTGITELGGLATSLLADRVVCLTTTAPESIEGTKVVADALRKAPRLASQKKLEIDFLITRVVSKYTDNLSRLKEELGGPATVLPHDFGIANEERVFAYWRSSKPNLLDEHDPEYSGTKLFSATLEWIASSFRLQPGEVETAQRRMEALFNAWNRLTARSKRSSGWFGWREPWPVDQIREQERVLGSDKESRLAHFAVYNAKGKLQMVIEYVDAIDCESIAHWWLTKTKVQVVALLWWNPKGYPQESLYSAKTVRDSRVRPSDRWDLPLPHDFDALSDPTDVSMESLLGAVRRGHAEYLDRIMREWIRSAPSATGGGNPWGSKTTSRMVDELALVDDIELAQKVLCTALRTIEEVRSDHELMHQNVGVDQQAIAELVAPLIWRLPPEISIACPPDGGHLDSRPGLSVIGLLARDVLGLRYDPDETFRIEARRSLERAKRDSNSDEDACLHELSRASRHMRISFEISSDAPPLAARQAATVVPLISKRIADRALLTTGLLGDYQPDLGRVLLYRSAISQCAEELDLKARHVGSVTLIHETLHALMHLGRDLDGRMWPEFALPSASSPLFEPSWFHETLTQYFTYQHILRLRDPALQHAFEAMSAKSAAPYRAWERLRNLPIEDARSWFMSVRRGVGAGSIPMQMVLEGIRQET